MGNDVHLRPFLSAPFHQDDPPVPPEVDCAVQMLLASLTDQQSAKLAQNTRLGRQLAFQARLRIQTQATFTALEQLCATQFVGPEVTPAWRQLSEAMRTLNRLRSRRPRHTAPGCDEAAVLSDHIKARYIAWGSREMLKLATACTAQPQMAHTADATANRQMQFLSQVLAGRYC